MIYLSGTWDLLKRVQNLVSLDIITSSASDEKCQQQQQSSCPRWEQVHLKEIHVHSLFWNVYFLLVICLHLESQPPAKNHFSICFLKVFLEAQTRLPPPTYHTFSTMNHLLREEKHLLLVYKTFISAFIHLFIFPLLNMGLVMSTSIMILIYLSLLLFFFLRGKMCRCVVTSVQVWTCSYLETIKITFKK